MRSASVRKTIDLLTKPFTRMIIMFQSCPHEWVGVLYVLDQALHVRRTQHRPVSCCRLIQSSIASNKRKYARPCPCLILYQYNTTHHSSVLGTAQVWLQEFAWSEAGKRKQLAARETKGQLVDESRDQCKLRAELMAAPMFCFESAINLLYMSAVVYDCEEVSLILLFIRKDTHSYCRCNCMVLQSGC